MQENPVFRHHPDFHPAAGEQIVEFPVAFPVQQGLDLGRCLVPAFLEGGFPDMLGNNHIRRIQFAVADDPHFRNGSNPLAHQFKDRAAEISGDAVVGLRIPQRCREKRMIEPLAAGGKAANALTGCRHSGMLVRNSERLSGFRKKSTKRARVT